MKSSRLSLLGKLFVVAAIFAVAGGGVYAGYQQLIRRDFRVLCEIYENAVRTRDEDPSAAPVMRADLIAQEIDGRILTRPVRQTVNAIAQASPENRLDLLKQAATQSGQADWDCPALISATSESSNPASADAPHPHLTVPPLKTGQSWDDKPPVGHPDHPERSTR